MRAVGGQADEIFAVLLAGCVSDGAKGCENGAYVAAAVLCADIVGDESGFYKRGHALCATRALGQQSLRWFRLAVELPCLEDRC